MLQGREDHSGHVTMSRARCNFVGTVAVDGVKGGVLLQLECNLHLHADYLLACFHWYG